MGKLKGAECKKTTPSVRQADSSLKDGAIDNPSVSEADSSLYTKEPLKTTKEREGVETLPYGENENSEFADGSTSSTAGGPPSPRGEGFIEKLMREKRLISKICQLKKLQCLKRNTVLR
ncbi:MAG: hypothetical protein IJC74_09420 [Clostridia bacterium]|nr:hypothetical protein [Clostridia bacterium]